MAIRCLAALQEPLPGSMICTPCGVQRVDGIVLRPELLRQLLLGGLVRWRLGDEHSGGDIALPLQFVVDEVPDTPGVTRRLTPPADALPERFVEASIKRVGQLVVPLDIARTVVHLDDVRGPPPQVDLRARPIRNRVHPPTTQPLVHSVVIDRAPLVSVLPPEVCLPEGIPVAFPAASPVELGQRRALFRQRREVMLAIPDPRCSPVQIDAVDPVRPKQSAFGIDQPPLPLVLARVVAARRFELRPAGPAPVLVPFRRTRMGRNVGLFLFARPHQVLRAMNLAGPVSVAVLAECIHKRSKATLQFLLRRRVILPDSQHPADLDDLPTFGKGHRYHDLGDLRWVDPIPVPREAPRQPKHPGRVLSPRFSPRACEIPAQRTALIQGQADDEDFHGLALAGEEDSRHIIAIVPGLRALAVHLYRDHRLFRRGIPQIDSYIQMIRYVPVAFGSLESNVRRFLAGGNLHAQSPALLRAHPRHPHTRTRHHRNDMGAFGEIQQHVAHRPGLQFFLTGIRRRHTAAQQAEQKNSGRT